MLSEIQQIQWIIGDARSQPVAARGRYYPQSCIKFEVVSKGVSMREVSGKDNRLLTVLRRPSWTNERGSASLAEYTLILCVIALVAVVNLTGVGENARRGFVVINDNLAHGDFENLENDGGGGNPWD